MKHTSSKMPILQNGGTGAGHSADAIQRGHKTLMKKQGAKMARTGMTNPPPNPGVQPNASNVAGVPAPSAITPH